MAVRACSQVPWDLDQVAKHVQSLMLLEYLCLRHLSGVISFNEQGLHLGPLC